MTETATATAPADRPIEIVIARHPSGWWRSVDGQWHRPDRAEREAQ